MPDSAVSVILYTNFICVVHCPLSLSPCACVKAGVEAPVSKRQRETSPVALNQAPFKCSALSPSLKWIVGFGISLCQCKITQV